MPLSNAVNSVMSTLRDSFKLFGSLAKDDTTKAPRIAGTNFDWGGNAIKDESPAEKEGAMRPQREEGANLDWRTDTIMDVSDGPMLLGGDDVWEDYGDDDEMPALTDVPRNDFEMIDRYNEANALLRSNGMQTIDYDRLETVDLTDHETPVTPPLMPSSPPKLTVRTVYDNYEDDDLETMIDVDDAAQVAAKVATSALAIGQERPSSSSTPTIIIHDSDSDIEIVHPNKMRTRSSTTVEPAANSTFEDDNPQATVDKSHLPLPERLRYDGEITVPQVIGKGAYEKPSILDAYIATPELKDLLENGGYPSEVLWACFLKNNTFYLDQSSGCDIMRLWLDQKPSRYRNITNLVFDEFLSHPRTYQKKLVQPHSWTVYRPIKLMAKCPNLQTVDLRFYIENLPGFYCGSAWYSKPELDVGKLTKALNERIAIGDMMTKVSKSLVNITMSLWVHTSDWKILEPAAEKLKKLIRNVFIGIAEANGRTKKEREAIDFEVRFKTYRT